jgi:hypothetical protein
MKGNIQNYLMVLFLILTLVGCKGEKGDTGLTGPSGNANVQTIQFTVAAADWKAMPTTGSYYYTKMSTLITPSVINGGTVILYYLLSSSVWASLPEKFVSSTGVGYEFHYIHGLQYGKGGIEIYLFSPSELKFDAIFKAVIIDGKLN